MAVGPVPGILAAHGKIDRLVGSQNCRQAGNSSVPQKAPVASNPSTFA